MYVKGQKALADKGTVYDAQARTSSLNCSDRLHPLTNDLAGAQAGEQLRIPWNGQVLLGVCHGFWLC
jgi:hypothetical protein